MLQVAFATKKLSPGENGEKEDAASFFCPLSFDRALMDRERHLRLEKRPPGQLEVSLWIDVTGFRVVPHVFCHCGVSSVRTGPSTSWRSINLCCLPSLIWYSPTTRRADRRLSSQNSTEILPGRAQGVHKWCRCMPTDGRRGERKPAQAPKSRHSLATMGSQRRWVGRTISIAPQRRRAARHSALQAPLEVPE